MEKTKIKESELDEVIEKGRAYYKDNTKFDPYFNACFKAFGRNHHWIDDILRGLFFKRDNSSKPSDEEERDEECKSVSETYT